MIRKFRSIEDMNAAQKPVLETDANRLAERARSVLSVTRAATGPRFRGVHKFRSMEEANHFRLQWMRARAQGT